MTPAPKTRNRFQVFLRKRKDFELLMSFLNTNLPYLQPHITRMLSPSKTRPDIPHLRPDIPPTQKANSLFSSTSAGFLSPHLSLLSRCLLVPLQCIPIHYSPPAGLSVLTKPSISFCESFRECFSCFKEIFK